MKQVAKIFFYGTWYICSDKDRYMVYYQYHEDGEKHRRKVAEYSTLAEAMNAMTRRIAYGS